MILAISITVILQLFSGGLRSAELSKNYLRAVYHARAKMEEIILAENSVEGTRDGHADLYMWRVTVEPVRQDDVENQVSSLMLYSVTVDISWQEGRHRKNFRTSTLRIGPAAIDEDNPPS